MNTNKNILIYFPSWGATQAVHNYIQVGQIPWDKVTTICHAFFEVDENNRLRGKLELLLAELKGEFNAE